MHKMGMRNPVGVDHETLQRSNRKSRKDHKRSVSGKFERLARLEASALRRAQQDTVSVSHLSLASLATEDGDKVRSWGITQAGQRPKVSRKDRKLSTLTDHRSTGEPKHLNGHGEPYDDEGAYWAH